MDQKIFAALSAIQHFVSRGSGRYASMKLAGISPSTYYYTINKLDPHSHIGPNNRRNSSKVVDKLLSEYALLKKIDYTPPEIDSWSQIFEFET